MLQPSLLGFLLPPLACFTIIFLRRESPCDQEQLQTPDPPASASGRQGDRRVPLHLLQAVLSLFCRNKTLAGFKTQVCHPASSRPAWAVFRIQSQPGQFSRTLPQKDKESIAQWQGSRLAYVDLWGQCPVPQRRKLKKKTYLERALLVLQRVLPGSVCWVTRGSSPSSELLVGEQMTHPSL